MNKYVLLVDDDPVFHIIFNRMIKKVDARLKVNSFLNGQIALEYLNENYSIDNQYIILLDINMPVNNGWQFLDEIKKWGIVKNNTMTLFIVSSSTDVDDIKKAKKYHFVKGILSKPLSIDSVKNILQPLSEE